MGTAASAAACAQGAGADVAASLRDELYLMSLQSPLAADSKLSAQLNSAITNCRIDALARMLLDAVCIMSTGCMPISISETGALLPVAAAMATDAGASQNVQFRCVYAHTDVAPPAAVFARYLARAIELYRRCDAYARGQIGDDAASSTGSVAFVGASLQAMGQASHLSSKVRRRAMMETLQAAYKEPPIVSSLRANVLLFLNELLSHHSAPLSALPLAECATFQHGSLLKRLLSGSPRTDLRATLTTPHAFLPCTCCEMGTPHTTSASQDDAVLAFKLLRNRYAKCRYIDIQPFFALFRGVCGPAITAALADARKRLATEAAAAAVNGEPASPSRGAAKRGAKAGVDKRATPGVKRRRSGAAVDDERDPHADIDMATLIEQPEVMTAEAIVQARFWTALHELKHVGVLRYARKRAAVVEQVLFDETTMW
ncbi:MAG: hypothetical protein EOO41_01605 [Methanobacteriota archaeon]|nr:MAG: hypothetical protein EOO41_01605 [Euryarchaeota archaeon]